MSLCEQLDIWNRKFDPISDVVKAADRALLKATDYQWPSELTEMVIRDYLSKPPHASFCFAAGRVRSEWHEFMDNSFASIQLEYMNICCIIDLNTKYVTASLPAGETVMWHLLRYNVLPVCTEIFSDPVGLMAIQLVEELLIPFLYLYGPIFTARKSRDLVPLSHASYQGRIIIMFDLTQYELERYLSVPGVMLRPVQTARQFTNEPYDDTVFGFDEAPVPLAPTRRPTRLALPYNGPYPPLRERTLMDPMITDHFLVLFNRLKDIHNRTPWLFNQLPLWAIILSTDVDLRPFYKLHKHPMLPGPMMFTTNIDIDHINHKKPLIVTKPPRLIPFFHWDQEPPSHYKKYIDIKWQKFRGYHRAVEELYHLADIYLN